MRPPIAAFDIETVPDTVAGRRLYGLSGDFLAVAEAMQELRREETGGRSDFLKPPLHRIVTISVAWLDPEREQFKLASLGADPSDEPDMLAVFFHILKPHGAHKLRPQLVSWNGNSFDLPVIRYRAMLHGIGAAPYYDTSDKFNNYLNRYHDQHTDLMDVLSGYGASDRVRLDDLCRLLGLPGKTVTEGHRVYLHVARGEWALVQTYCELDALNTLLLYLAYELSRGKMTQSELCTWRDRIAMQLRADERSPMQEYGAALEHWLPGADAELRRRELSAPAYRDQA